MNSISNQYDAAKDENYVKFKNCLDNCIGAGWVPLKNDDVKCSNCDLKFTAIQIDRFTRYYTAPKTDNEQP